MILQYILNWEYGTEKLSLALLSSLKMGLAKSLLHVYLAILPLTLALTAVKSTVVSIPYEYSYLLPNSFEGNVSTGFVDTTFSDEPALSSLFAKAKEAPFVSYSDEFLDIVGEHPQLKLVAEMDEGEFAYEAGIWVYERNEVWFTSSLQVGGRTKFRILNLDTYEITIPDFEDSVTNPNGGTYFDGLVYFATYQSPMYPAAVVSVNPSTGKVKTLFNSYFGLRLVSPDDLVWMKRKQDKKPYLFFTDLDYAVCPRESVLEAKTLTDQTGTCVPNKTQASAAQCSVAIRRGVRSPAHGWP